MSRNSGRVVGGTDYGRAGHAQRPPGTAQRPGTTSRTQRGYVPPHRTYDHRYARPHYRNVRPHPYARYGVPSRWHYRPYYSRWYVHPYYRYHHSVVVVNRFGWYVDPWGAAWVPPTRGGWMWVGGYYRHGYWHPGYWAPPQRVVYTGYAYVPGWWVGETYVEGYQRPEQRDDGDWVWVDGYYLEDGTYIWGHWMPTRAGPQGYVWEPGFYDGETYVDGFWRPQFRRGFAWVSAYYGDDGVFRSGYWMPEQQQVGFTWVPGWFDGNTWNEGSWVEDSEFMNADIDSWEPAEGWQDGWDAEPVTSPQAVQGSPLALPVVLD